MTKPVVIFGIGQAAELAHFYFTNDTDRSVAAFTVDKAYLEKDSLCDLPVVPFEDITTSHPPDQFDFFVALGYANINQLREKKFLEAKSKGYTCVSYISSMATILIDKNTIGENCFILEDNTIQPFVEIGHNVTLWSGNHIGHHAKIGDHCFLTSHVVVSGNTVVGDYTFIGVNATLRNEITIGPRCVIGAGSWIHKDVAAESVLTAQPADLRKKKSGELASL